MPRTNKKTCPKCGFYNIKISPENNKQLIDEFAFYQKEGKPKTNDKMFNKILSEYFFLKNTKGIIL